MGRKPTLMKKLQCPMCDVVFEVKNTKRNVGRKFCSGFCAKSANGKANKGRKHTEEWKRSMGERNSGENNPFFGKTHTAEVIARVSKANTGKKHTKESSEKKRQWMLKNNPFKGKKHTIESRKKMRRDVSGTKNPMYNKGYLLKGERNGAWQGGISPLYVDYGGEFTKELKTEIRKRDKFVCSVCAKNGWIVHHIDYDKLNNDKRNLITVCPSCHGKTGFNREYWIIYFREKMEVLHG